MHEQPTNPIIQPTNPIIQPTNHIITNQTARRIGIRSKEGDDQLIIPPFGSLTLREEIRQKFNLDVWKERNLITDVPEPVQADDLRTALPGCFFLLLILFLVVTIPLAIFSIVNWLFVVVGSVVFLIPMVIGFINVFKPKERPKEASRQYRQWFTHLPSLIIALPISIGIPVVVVYFFGDGMVLLAQAQAGTITPLLLGRGLQLGLVCIASLLPMLMYFMFGRQQLDQLRKNFIREVMMLDPNVETTLEARTKYDPLFDSVYGAGNTPLDSLPIYVSTALITFGWILTLLPIGQSLALADNNIAALFMPHVTAINFGFLGAYFFAINMVFRRYVRADLTMKTYTHISIRLLVTTILVWVVSSLTELLGGESGTDSPAILLLAFIIGIFPETGATLISDFYRKIFSKVIEPLEELHPVTNLEGVNLYDQARLLEEGIENIENLAHHNLVELVARTRIPIPRLVDLLDQAILYLHLGLDVNKLKATRQQLREYGIRTATDLLKIEEKNLLTLLNDDTLVNKLKAIRVTLSDDEWMAYLKHWRASTAANQAIAQLEDFYVQKLPATTDNKGDKQEHVSR